MADSIESASRQQNAELLASLFDREEQPSQSAVGVNDGSGGGESLVTTEAPTPPATSVQDLFQQF